ncbi:MAG: dihydrolipoyl dehydrogenase [Firmicutes bacterium]|nr:dihydrolipoyl dehydrogenase [Bacillota bacterium]
MVVGELTEDVDLLVVGGGPGGYVAAIRAAQLGRQVVLIERGAVGGVCLNVGCIPSKALIQTADDLFQLQKGVRRGIAVSAASVNLSEFQAFKAGVVARLTGGVRQLLNHYGVRVMEAEARFLDPHQVRAVGEFETVKVRFRHAIVATGSRPRPLDLLPIDGRVVCGSTELLALSRIPAHLVVVGAGYIGLELGTAFRKLGSAVTVLEARSQILPGYDPALVRLVARRLEELGVEVRLNAELTSATVGAESAEIHVTGPRGSATLTADAVLVSVGRIPNTDDLDLSRAQIRLGPNQRVEVDEALRTSNPDVAAIGDIVPGPMLAHKASYQGRVAAESLSGLPSAFDATAVPAVIFTDPEIATVGMTESEARAAGYDPVTGRFPYAANGRAMTLGAEGGEAVVVADRASGQVLGIHVLGAHASDLVGEAALAVEMGATLEDLALTMHAHPTLAETLMEAAEAALGRPIHVVLRSSG